MRRLYVLGISMALCGGLAVAETPQRTVTNSATNAGTNAGRVDAKEFRDLDANHDGKLTPTEARSDGQLSGTFKALDSDGDGKLTEQEYDRYAHAAGSNAGTDRGAPSGSMSPPMGSPSSGNPPPSGTGSSGSSAGRTGSSGAMPGGAGAAAPGTR